MTGLSPECPIPSHSTVYQLEVVCSPLRRRCLVQTATDPGSLAQRLLVGLSFRRGRKKRRLQMRRRSKSKEVLSDTPRSMVPSTLCTRASATENRIRALYLLCQGDYELRSQDHARALPVKVHPAASLPQQRAFHSGSELDSLPRLEDGVYHISRIQDSLRPTQLSAAPTRRRRPRAIRGNRPLTRPTLHATVALFDGDSAVWARCRAMDAQGLGRSSCVRQRGKH
jgi:hypothetical protein